LTSARSRFSSVERYCNWITKLQEADVVGVAGDSTSGSTSVGGGPSKEGTCSSKAGGAGQSLAEGLQFSMPESGGIDETKLKAEGIGEIDAGVQDLMAQLAALSGSK
jgi:hypothetical protein